MISLDDEHAKGWVIDLFNQRWANKLIPTDWHVSRIIALFKKGDIGDCNNYRPISLIVVTFKLLAHILLQRLKSGDAESCIWHTQFGFKSGRGTHDALCATSNKLSTKFLPGELAEQTR